MGRRVLVIATVAGAAASVVGCGGGTSDRDTHPRDVVRFDAHDPDIKTKVEAAIIRQIFDRARARGNSASIPSDLEPDCIAPDDRHLSCFIDAEGAHQHWTATVDQRTGRFRTELDTSQ